MDGEVFGQSAGQIHGPMMLSKARITAHIVIARGGRLHDLAGAALGDQLLGREHRRRIQPVVAHAQLAIGGGCDAGHRLAVRKRQRHGLFDIDVRAPLESLHDGREVQRGRRQNVDYVRFQRQKIR